MKVMFRFSARWLGLSFTFDTFDTMANRGVDLISELVGHQVNIRCFVIAGK